MTDTPSSKAQAPIDVTELGMVTSVRPKHSLKAPSMMVTAERGISIAVRPEQWLPRR